MNKKHVSTLQVISDTATERQPAENLIIGKRKPSLEFQFQNKFRLGGLGGVGDRLPRLNSSNSRSNVILTPRQQQLQQQQQMVGSCVQLSPATSNTSTAGRQAGDRRGRRLAAARPPRAVQAARAQGGGRPLPQLRSLHRLSQQPHVPQPPLQVSCTAGNEPSQKLKFHNHRDGQSTMAFSWLKSPTSTLTLKTL